VRSEALLEREGELEALRLAVGATRQGSGQLVLVEGAAGVGKSRLLDAAGDAAAGAGLVVLVAQGSELERGVSYGLARELLQPLVGDGSFSGAAALAAPLFAGADDGPGLVQGLYGLLRDSVRTSGGALLQVDDAQWCDRGSLRFLAYVAQRLADLPVVLVVACRPVPAGGEDPLVALRARPSVVLRPGPLGEAGVRTLVRDALGDDASDEFARSCGLATGGNPFYLGELLAVLHEGRRQATSTKEIEHLLPPALLRTTMLRLAALGADAARLASAVAVLGDGCTLRTAIAVADLTLEVAEPAADALAAAHLVAPGEPLRFAHPLIGSAVREDMGAFARPLG
jgi:predicted ATPase